MSLHNTSQTPFFRKKTVENRPLAGSSSPQQNSLPTLKRTLGVWDITAFGVAAILGAGIFSTIGNAASTAGPAVVFLFIFTAIACTFSAFCYAEFASILPHAGSAYTYAYHSLGEIFAWIIGWDLLMEYSISNIVVAISWSQYFSAFLAGYGVHIPQYLTIDLMSAWRAKDQINQLLLSGQNMQQITEQVSTLALSAYQAWLHAPRFFGVPLICDLPALLITIIITAIAYIGIEESKRISNILVFLKVMIVILVIIAGSFYIHPSHWVPFAPHGIGGIFKGVSAVFFAYIGFDAISTTAEECKNPQRDLPRGMIYSLMICTVLYALVALVLTGMVSYKKLAIGDPLAFVFGPEGANVPWVSMLVEISAIIALSTVLLVYQIGQPRIWIAMSRDGLLPPLFSKIHPRFRTPSFSTILAGFFVAIPSLFMNLTEVTDLTSTGTLFAFILVCWGTLKINHSQEFSNRKFKIPYLNSKYIFPFFVFGSLAFIALFLPNELELFYKINDLHSIYQKIPMIIYWFSLFLLSYFCYFKNLSLIPVLGLASCGYLMTELGTTNWIRFGIWLVIGFLIYFFYGMKFSRLRSQ